MFSIGLLTILMFKFDLFTGKAGLLATDEISVWRLLGIWVGNLFGCFLVAASLSLTPVGATLGTTASAIAATRLANGMLANTVLGGCCGILMYIAVNLFGKKDNPLYAMMPVATFILSGYNHCIADMFCFFISGASLPVWATLIPTTIGNVLGALIIPIVIKWKNFYHLEV